MPEDGGFFEVMKDAISAMAASAPAQEMGGQIERMVTQGAAELASALFGESNAYVAYGDGQKAVEVEAPQIQPEQPVQAVEAPQVQQERGGMEM
jgi:hypothetical protein